MSLSSHAGSTDQDYANDRQRPAVGDISAEGAAVGSAGIPLNSDVVKRGDQIFTEESKGARTDEVLK